MHHWLQYVLVVMVPPQNMHLEPAKLVRSFVLSYLLDTRWNLKTWFRTKRVAAPAPLVLVDSSYSWFQIRSHP